MSEYSAGILTSSPALQLWDVEEGLAAPVGSRPTQVQVLLAREAAVAEWESANAMVAELASEPAEPPLTVTVTQRIVRQLLHGARRKSPLAARRIPDLWLRGEHLRRLMVGAGHGWGVLSGGHLTHGDGNDRLWTLEDVLDRARFSLHGDAREQAVALLAELPELRARVHRHDETASALVGRVEDIVIKIATDPPCERGTYWALIDFVPASRRPAVANLDDLFRCWREGGPLVTLFVDWTAGSDRVITLHDITMNPGMQGRGVGTEALNELCAFADKQQATIRAQFMPHTEARRPVAHWYARAGFSAGAAPDQWRSGTWIRRPPVPCTETTASSC